MKNSTGPSGPGNPLAKKRDQEDLREQVNEILNPQAERLQRDGQVPTRNEPSPNPRNQTVPDTDSEAAARERQQNRGG